MLDDSVKARIALAAAMQKARIDAPEALVLADWGDTRVSAAHLAIGTLSNGSIDWAIPSSDVDGFKLLDIRIESKEPARRVRRALRRMEFSASQPDSNGWITFRPQLASQTDSALRCCSEAGRLVEVLRKAFSLQPQEILGAFVGSDAPHQTVDGDPAVEALINALTLEIQARRRRSSGEPVGVIIELDGTAFVQWSLNGTQLGADGLWLMAVEIGPKPIRVSDEQLVHLRTHQWSPPQGRSMPNWWTLVGEQQEAEKVAVDIVVLLSAVFGVDPEELAALGVVCGVGAG